MSFIEVVDRVIELLGNRRRISYRALKLEFELSDEELEGLKEELFYSHPQVVDDEGRGLVDRRDGSFLRTEQCSSSIPRDLHSTLPGRAHSG
jgi:hypothetical protein